MTLILWGPCRRAIGQSPRARESESKRSGQCRPKVVRLGFSPWPVLACPRGRPSVAEGHPGAGARRPDEIYCVMEFRGRARWKHQALRRGTWPPASARLAARTSGEPRRMQPKQRRQTCEGRRGHRSKIHVGPRTGRQHLDTLHPGQPSARGTCRASARASPPYVYDQHNSALQVP